MRASGGKWRSARPGMRRRSGVVCGSAGTSGTLPPDMYSPLSVARMLCVLKDGCWGDATDADGGPVAAACRAAMRAGVTIVLAHETAPERGGHPHFADLMAQVPEDLRAAGMLGTLSIGLLHGDDYRAASVALLAQALARSVLPFAPAQHYRLGALLAHDTHAERRGSALHKSAHLKSAHLKGAHHRAGHPKAPEITSATSLGSVLRRAIAVSSFVFAAGSHAQTADADADAHDDDDADAGAEAGAGAHIRPPAGAVIGMQGTPGCIVV